MQVIPTEFRAVVQAGGPGTRMRRESEELPKHLLKVREVPIVERLVRQLSEAGLRDIWVITGHLGDKVEHHLKSLQGLPADLRLSFVREFTPRGDIGSISQLPADTRPLITAYGDLVTELNFQGLMEIHCSRNSDVTLASHYETHRVRLGELVADGDRVVRYLEKPIKRFLICSGISVLESHVVTLANGYTTIGLDQLVELALARGDLVTHWQHGAYWRDVNDPSQLREVNETLPHASAITK
jgi:NDP-sugar pyrophosphorylase family protein